ncbi:putative F-box protein CPR30-like [Capsicum annuum]|nr:putative F-box protein CPR30-like [Capsicum annuum]
MCCLNPCLWPLYPFDFRDHLEYGGSYTPNLVFGQDDKQTLIEVVGTHPYDEESFSKISNLLEEPKLCKRRISNKAECFKEAFVPNAYKKDQGPLERSLEGKNEPGGMGKRLAKSSVPNLLEQLLVMLVVIDVMVGIVVTVMMVAVDSDGGSCDVTLVDVSSWRSSHHIPTSLTPFIPCCITGGAIFSAYLGDNSMRRLQSCSLRRLKDFGLQAQGENAAVSVDSFASASLTAQHGNFQRRFLDLTRVHTSFDFPSGSKLLSGITSVACSLYNSQVPNIDALQAICPRASLCFQQQLEFVALDISGKNYLSWVLDVEIHLAAKGLRLKLEYLTMKDSLELWTDLKGRGRYNNRHGGGNKKRENQMGPQNNPSRGSSHKYDDNVEANLILKDDGFDGLDNITYLEAEDFFGDQN